MFPAANNPVLPAEASWTSTAFSNLSTGVGGLYDPALGSQHASGDVTEGPTLSQSIAEQVEDQLDEDSQLKAQDSREIEQEDAQERRLEESLNEVSDARWGSQSSETGKLSRDSNSTVRLPLRAMGRVHGQASSLRAQASAVEALPSKPLSNVDVKSTQSSQLIAQPVLRGVPAAVLRAIEVEANIESGGRNMSLLRSGQNTRGHAPAAIKTMAEAEARTLQGMTTLMAQRGGRMRVQLNPLQLGSVTIDVKVDGNRVEASIEAATKAAVKVLEASTSRLRLSLESQGYNLDRLEIKHEQQPSGATENSRSEDEPRDSRSDKSDSDGRSRRNRTSVGQHATNGFEEEFNLTEQAAQETDR